LKRVQPWTASVVRVLVQPSTHLIVVIARSNGTSEGPPHSACNAMCRSKAAKCTALAGISRPPHARRSALTMRPRCPGWY
jgi:hypothetical protein